MEKNVTSNTLCKIIRLGAMIGLSIATFSASAINTSEVNAQQNQPEPEIEIITITGSQPLHFFRDQLEFAEDNFYAALNEMMDDESFKIDCKMKKNSFSHITDRRVCEPKYVSEIKYLLTQTALRGRAQLSNRFQDQLYKLPTRAALNNRFVKARKLHLAAVRKHVENSPELQQKLLNVNKAKYSFNKKHLETFGDLSGKERKSVAADTKEFVENLN